MYLVGKDVDFRFSLIIRYFKGSVIRISYINNSFGFDFFCNLSCIEVNCIGKIGFGFFGWCRFFFFE